MPERIGPVSKSTWTFMTNHSHVLVCLANNSAMRARDIALEVGITERAVLRILKELIEGQFVEATKKGRIKQETWRARVRGGGGGDGRARELERRRERRTRRA